jgi:hypothetical protein
LSPATTIRALCIRTKMIGDGNTFQILIPLDDINPEGQNYQVIRGSKLNRCYLLFVDGIEPYTSDIMKMPQGFERYDRFRQHERETKIKELALLQRAFPESNLKPMTIW